MSNDERTQEQIENDLVLHSADWLKATRERTEKAADTLHDTAKPGMEATTAAAAIVSMNSNRELAAAFMMSMQLLGLKVKTLGDVVTALNKTAIDATSALERTDAATRRLVWATVFLALATILAAGVGAYLTVKLASLSEAEKLRQVVASTPAPIAQPVPSPPSVKSAPAK